MSTFEHYIGIDYSGAETPTTSLRGLRAYCASRSVPPTEALPPPGRKKYWTRRGLAEWLEKHLREEPPTLVGIDHAFSFPLKYFEEHGLAHDWATFLGDFHRHWPTDDDTAWVRDVRQDKGAARRGKTEWKRLTEQGSGAKSVFQFGVNGSVANSTHAGLPWLLYLRRNLGERVHFWPFDGWEIPTGRSAVVEVYPRLWSPLFTREDRTGDQQDAYAVAAWMRRTDLKDSLPEYLEPNLNESEKAQAQIEGWIFGIPSWRH